MIEPDEAKNPSFDEVSKKTGDITKHSSYLIVVAKWLLIATVLPIALTILVVVIVIFAIVGGTVHAQSWTLLIFILLFTGLIFYMAKTYKDKRNNLLGHE